MPISNVRFTGYQPALTAAQKFSNTAKASKPVAFTGIKYHRIITSQISFKSIWTGIKELFTNIGKFLNFVKPHTDKANAVLDKGWKTIWSKIKPIA